MIKAGRSERSTEDEPGLRAISGCSSQPNSEFFEALFSTGPFRWPSEALEAFVVEEWKLCADHDRDEQNPHAHPEMSRALKAIRNRPSRESASKTRIGWELQTMSAEPGSSSATGSDRGFIICLAILGGSMSWLIVAMLSPIWHYTTRAICSTRSKARRFVTPSS